MKWLALGCSGLSACVLLGYERLDETPDAGLGAAVTIDATPTADVSSVPPEISAQAEAGLPDCNQSGWCTYSCGGTGAACEFTCKSGQFCRIDCAGETGCAGVTCEQGATCAITCPDSDLWQCGGECAAGSTTCARADVMVWCGSC